jgi:hypothetical protein
MLTDDQFAALLADRMVAETADLRPAPGLTGTLRRRHTRQTWGVRAGVAAPLAAAAVAVALIATAGPGGRAAPQATGSHQATQIHDVAYISTQAQAALAGASDFVICSTMVVVGNSTMAVCSDAKTGRYRIDTRDASGRQIMTQTTSATLGKEPATVVGVDYVNRSWWTFTVPAWRPGSKVKRPGLKFGNSLIVAAADSSDPDAVRAAIASGKLVQRGTERVDGRDTLHLRVSEASSGASTKSIGLDLWVDAKTYQLVRLTSGSPKSPDFTRDYKWLPRDAKNLADLEVKPPAGFRQIDASPTK